MVRFVCALLLLACPTAAFIPLLDGGKGMPKLYDGWFNDQLSKQAASAVSRVRSDGGTEQKWQVACAERAFGVGYMTIPLQNKIPVASHRKDVYGTRSISFFAFLQ